MRVGYTFYPHGYLVVGKSHPTQWPSDLTFCASTLFADTQDLLTYGTGTDLNKTETSKSHKVTLPETVFSILLYQALLPLPGGSRIHALSLLEARGGMALSKVFVAIRVSSLILSTTSAHHQPYSFPRIITTPSTCKNTVLWNGQPWVQNVRV